MPPIRSIFTPTPTLFPLFFVLRHYPLWECRGRGSHEQAETHWPREGPEARRGGHHARNRIAGSGPEPLREDAALEPTESDGWGGTFY